MRPVLFLWCVFGLCSLARGQSGCVTSPPLSPRIANYVMDVILDAETKTLTGSEAITWVNTSPDTLHELRFYMYANAFRNTNSTFLKGAESSMFGKDIRSWTREEWGYIELNRIAEYGSADRLGATRYIHPDDGNVEDQTVLSYALKAPLPPGDTVELQLDFTLKMPRLLVRIGYSRDDFFHFTHWFPQLGVYEPQENGKWAWNCHQFHRRTEFFSDFGNYQVTIDAPDHLVIDGTGCIVDHKVDKGRQVVHFYAEDVIDFAWAAYPNFVKVEDQWKGIDITMMVTCEHANLIPRWTHALKFALAYLEKNIGPYPYPVIKVMDPPMHALSSGFMEYPMYITLGAFRYFPHHIRSIESLLIHELTHQYFMAVIATNEKEEAWMDEGFVTYYEDRIMEALFCADCSLLNVGFVKIANSELTRGEYVHLPDPSVFPPAQPGWKFEEGYKGLVYSKTATTLKTLENVLGREVFDPMIRDYFQRFQFLHPRQKDLFGIFEKHIGKSQLEPQEKESILSFLDQMINGTGICDYTVSSLRVDKKVGMMGLVGQDQRFVKNKEDGYESTVVLRRNGTVIIPVEVEVVFDDGRKERFNWLGKEKRLERTFDGVVQTCTIDPANKVWVDVNLTNNCLSRRTDEKSLWKASSQVSLWIQNLLQSLSVLI